MRILLAASEVTPLARTGGLGDVLEGLPPALLARGHEVSVVLPCYRGLREDPRFAVEDTGVNFVVPVGWKRIEATVLEAAAPNGTQVFLIRCDEYFDRPGLYGDESGDFADNAERFVFFSKAIVELSRRVIPPPEIVHVHDWQTALVPVLVKHGRLPLRTVLTIHNLAYQGSFGAADFGLTNLPGELFSARGLEFYGSMNLLKGGILAADAVTTVSEHYAREIQSAEFGCGLDAVIREHAHKLRGILNGADYSQWNPSTDRALPHTFTLGNLADKEASRDVLLAETGLMPKPAGPVFVMVSRLAEQKGIDLLLPLIDRLLSGDVRLVVLGQGDSAYEREFTIASRRHPERFAYQKSMDDRLAHLILAGGDIALIPSRFEPCGLTSMYALKYGTLPIARATGGLHQIVQDYDPSNGTGNGIMFFDYSSAALWDAIVRALGYFADQTRWQGMMQRAMAADFSWARAVEQYEEVYAADRRA